MPESTLDPSEGPLDPDGLRAGLVIMTEMVNEVPASHFADPDVYDAALELSQALVHQCHEVVKS